MVDAASKSRSSWPRWLPWVLDIALAAFATGAAVALHLEVVSGLGADVSVPWLAVAALHGLALLARRSRPVGTMVFLLVTAGVNVLVGGFPVFMLGPATLIAVYTVGARVERNRSFQVLVLVEAVLVILLLVGPSYPGFSSLFLYGALIATSWFLGDLAQRWRTAAELHEARAVELTAAREELARRAVAEERLRIARELHDVVAHSMTVVALQAGSGRIAAAHDSDTAQDVLETIERSSREALADMRRLVGVLRAEDDTTVEPAPTLADIDRLGEEMKAAGVEVEISKKGVLNAVPPGLALAAYRIAQEALTNVVRHSGTDRAELALDMDGDQLTVRVRNGAGGGAVDQSVDGGGHGLAGMRERAMLYGGTLTAGPLDNGGFLVEARIPLTEADT